MQSQGAIKDRRMQRLRVCTQRLRKIKYPRSKNVRAHICTMTWHKSPEVTHAQKCDIVLTNTTTTHKRPEDAQVKGVVQSERE